MSHEEGTSPALFSPWAEFLGEIDHLLPDAIELHCLGGFVLVSLYGLTRRTGDVDYIEAVPTETSRILLSIAGHDTALAKKHKLQVHHVGGVAPLPEDYKERLVEMFPRRFSKLKLYALEPHDLMLAKLTRNSAVDRDDLRSLKQAGLVDVKVLRERYQRELRPYLANEKWHDQTMELWAEES